ncbi:hypothetical protein BDP27DRAFT_488808 [Rhodocollybia butyracea]|uniref:F-box domain-containing protein n=1 Tax=Rhodocollybia butyracea TaxID=206335 RepID=A0A9P5UFY2_9AGAR|nr:hypothetical protein BDP27DRAFT_488808 [Rhodocollybia butyracea]
MNAPPTLQPLLDQDRRKYTNIHTMTTSSSFIDLPDDVLFNIFRFLRPPDILTVRKTCKRLEAATLEPHVWTTAYRTCNNDFLPVVSSPSQMVTSDLERLLLHTCQLETLWGNPAAPECFFKKNQHT